MAESGREKVRQAKLERGLYILRYDTAKDQFDAPDVFVRPADQDVHNVRLICPPGSDEHKLPGPGTAVVVLVYEESTLVLTARPKEGGRSVEAELKVEPVVNGALAPRTTTDPAVVAVEPDASLPELSILLHVARRGDVVIAPGTWIGGVESPALVEGLEVSVPANAGTELEYQVLTEGSGYWSDWVRNGEFAGSRGKARAVTGMRFRLVGEKAFEFSCVGEAQFDQGGVVRQEGASIELASPSGLAPLIGFSFSLSRDKQNRGGPVPEPAQKPRVRVFRAARPTL